MRRLPIPDDCVERDGGELQGVARAELPREDAVLEGAEAERVEIRGGGDGVTKTKKGFDRKEPARARRDGMPFFSDPMKLRPAQIDRRIRRAVSIINSSGWAWTAQSCAGHPDWDGKTRPGEHGIGRGWQGGRASEATDPMLKIVVRRDHVTALLSCLAEAMHSDLVECDEHGFHPRRETPAAMLSFVGPRRRTGFRWRAVVIRFPASNVFERNRGLIVFGTFAQVAREVGRRWGVAKK